MKTNFLKCSSFEGCPKFLQSHLVASYLSGLEEGRLFCLFLTSQRMAGTETGFFFFLLIHNLILFSFCITAPVFILRNTARKIQKLSPFNKRYFKPITLLVSEIPNTFFQRSHQFTGFFFFHSEEGLVEMSIDRAV